MRYRGAMLRKFTGRHKGVLATRTHFSRSRIVILVATMVALVAACARAQPATDRLTSGARIRIRAPEAGIPDRTVGVLDSLVRDTLYVGQLHEPPPVRGMKFAVPVRSVERFDVSTGRASRWSHARRGAVWGLAAYGVLAGAYVIHEKATCRGADCFGEGFAWLGMVVAIPWAAGTGAAVGFALPVETWRPVAVGRAS